MNENDEARPTRDHRISSVRREFGSRFKTLSELGITEEQFEERRSKAIRALSDLKYKDVRSDTVLGLDCRCDLCDWDSGGPGHALGMLIA